MKKTLMIASVLSAFLLALPAQAQQGPGGGMGPGAGPCSTGQDCPGGGAMKGAMMGGTAMMDCSKSRQPERCEARNQAVEKCKDKTGPARRQCIQEKMPPVDCSKSRAPERCEAAQKAREACKDKTGAERHSCMREKMGQPVKPKAGKTSPVPAGK